MTMPLNLGALIDCGADADALALVELDEALEPVQYRFGELDALADGVAAALAAQYARGERIAVLAANSAHYVATVLGIMRAGLVAVPVNFRFPRALVAGVIADSGARAVFCDPKRVADIPAGVPGIVDDVLGRFDGIFVRSVAELGQQ